MLSSEQREMLVIHGVEEDRLNTDSLSPREMVLLKTYDAALSYLNDKYPSLRAQLKDCMMGGILDSYNEFFFEEREAPHSKFSVRVANRDEAYDAIETYFAARMKEPFVNAAVETVSSVFPDARIFATIDGFFGDEYDENTTLDEALDRGLSSTIWLITATKAGEEDFISMTDECARLLLAARIRGSIVIYALNEMPDEPQDAVIDNILSHTNEKPTYRLRSFRVLAGE